MYASSWRSPETEPVILRVLQQAHVTGTQIIHTLQLSASFHQRWRRLYKILHGQVQCLSFAKDIEMTSLESQALKTGWQPHLLHALVEVNAKS